MVSVAIGMTTRDHVLRGTSGDRSVGGRASGGRRRRAKLSGEGDGHKHGTGGRKCRADKLILRREYEPDALYSDGRIYEEKKIGEREEDDEREDYYSAMAHIWYSTYRAAPPRVLFLFSFPCHFDDYLWGRAKRKRDLANMERDVMGS